MYRTLHKPVEGKNPEAPTSKANITISRHGRRRRQLEKDQLTELRNVKG